MGVQLDVIKIEGTATALVSAGEATGKIDVMLEKMADFCQNVEVVD